MNNWFTVEEIDLINEIDDGFTEIFNSGKLKQGNGIFKFTNFQIYI